MNVTTYKGCVYPWHCDHMGHMNVMWYVGKFDEANWNFFAELGLTPDYFQAESRGMAAVRQNITYKQEAMPGDLIVVGSRLVELGGKSLRVVHEMTNGTTAEVLAVCELTCVHLDRQRRKAVAFPDAIHARMALKQSPP